MSGELKSLPAEVVPWGESQFVRVVLYGFIAQNMIPHVHVSDLPHKCIICTEPPAVAIPVLPQDDARGPCDGLERLPGAGVPFHPHLGEPGGRVPGRTQRASVVQFFRQAPEISPRISVIDLVKPNPWFVQDKAVGVGRGGQGEETGSGCDRRRTSSTR